MKHWKFVYVNNKTQMKLLLAFLAAASIHAGDYITVTAYCPCAKCCGQWASVPMAQRRTASGGRLTPGRTAAGSPDFKFGDKVTVEMSPYDLSKGRIVHRNK